MERGHGCRRTQSRSYSPSSGLSQTFANAGSEAPVTALASRRCFRRSCRKSTKSSTSASLSSGSLRIFSISSCVAALSGGHGVHIRSGHPSLEGSTGRFTGESDTTPPGRQPAVENIPVTCYASPAAKPRATLSERYSMMTGSPARSRDFPSRAAQRGQTRRPCGRAAVLQKKWKNEPNGSKVFNGLAFEFCEPTPRVVLQLRDRDREGAGGRGL